MFHVALRGDWPVLLSDFELPEHHAWPVLGSGDIGEMGRLLHVEIRRAVDRLEGREPMVAGTHPGPLSR